MKNLTEAQLKEKSLEYKNGMLEGGEGYNPFQIELEKRHENGVEKMIAEKEAEWTLETTIARRELFNKSGVTGKTLKAVEARLGFTMVSLKIAVAKFGL